MSTDPIETKPEIKKRASLKVSPEVWEKVMTIREQRKNPKTFKMPKQETIVAEFYDAWERERLNQSAPILGNSSLNPLTPVENSDTICLRPKEKERVAGLLAILRSGDAKAIRQITGGIEILLVELEESRNAGESKPEGERAPGAGGSDTTARGGVARKVRNSPTEIGGKGN